MNAKDYIICKLDAFLDLFKNAKIRYEYDSLAKIHCVEVVPKELYESKEFCQWEDDSIMNFIKEFPEENLYFFSDDSIVGILREDYAKEGIDFAKYTSNDDCIVELNEDSLSSNIYSLLTFSSVEPTIINVRDNEHYDIESTRTTSDIESMFSFSNQFTLAA